MDAIQYESEHTAPIVTPTDREVLSLYFAGGFKAVSRYRDLWEIVPIFVEGRPCVKGFLNREQLQRFSAKFNLTGLGFQDSGWLQGSEISFWNPIIPSQKRHTRSPTDLWGNIRFNISRERMAEKVGALEKPSFELIAAIADDKTAPERLAGSIALSLRNLDISIQQIARFYHSQLVTLLATGGVKGNRRGTVLDQNLYAHVQAFFLHLGAARDYLAAFIAHEIGMDSAKIDSMARLIERLQPKHISSNKVLEFLKQRGDMVSAQASLDKFEQSGWLKEATTMRNLFVHKRPYGSLLLEHMGYVAPIDEKEGLFKYVRPMMTDREGDVLDTLVVHYQNVMTVFEGAAERSGLDHSMATFGPSDIKDFKILQ